MEAHLSQPENVKGNENVSLSDLCREVRKLKGKCGFRSEVLDCALHFTRGFLHGPRKKYIHMRDQHKWALLLKAFDLKPQAEF